MSFDLATGPLLRVAHFGCGPDDPDRLFVAIHHFAVDGLTWPVVLEDSAQAYRQATGDTDVSLPAKTTSFKAWAHQLLELAETAGVVRSADRWLRLPWTEVASLPLDFDADMRANTNASAAVAEVELSVEDTQRLFGGPLRPERVIIAALARSLSSWTGSDTVLMDVLSHGRDAATDGVNLSRTVAFTLSYNPLVLSHPTWEAVPQTLGSVNAQIEELPEGYSFELLRFLSSRQELRRQLTMLPRAELLFNYAGPTDSERPDRLFTRATEATGPAESPRGLREHPVAVRATTTPNLRLTFVYSSELHRRETLEAKAAEVASAIRALLG